MTEKNYLEDLEMQIQQIILSVDSYNDLRKDSYERQKSLRKDNETIEKLKDRLYAVSI